MIRLAIRVARADAEVALAELLELAPAGVEEVDHGDTIEYAVYGAEGELPSLPDAARRGRRRARRGDDDAGRRRLGLALARLPRAGHDRRAAARAPALV